MTELPVTRLHVLKVLPPPDGAPAREQGFNLQASEKYFQSKRWWLVRLFHSFLLSSVSQRLASAFHLTL